MVEIIVRVKDDEQTLTQRFMQDEGFVVSPTDAILKSYIDQTLANFKGKPDDVTVKIICSW